MGLVKLYVKTESLIPHPKENLMWGMATFGIKQIEEWEKSIKENGIIKPLLVNWKGCVIDGNMRFQLALKHDIEFVPIDLFYLMKDIEGFENCLNKMFISKIVEGDNVFKKVIDELDLMKGIVKNKIEEHNSEDKKEC